MDAATSERRATLLRTAKSRGASAADLKFPHSMPRVRTGNFKSKAALGNWLNFASALCFPKFAKGAPRECTNFGKRALDAPTLASSRAE